MAQGRCRKPSPGSRLAASLVLLATTIAFDALATVRTITDPAGFQEQWEYVEVQGALRIVGKHNLVDDRREVFDYDAQGNRVYHRSVEGTVTVATYNEHNQKISETIAQGTPAERTTRYAYLSAQLDLPLRVTTPSVHAEGLREVLVTYNEHRQRVRHEVRGFDPAGNPLSRATGYAYDELGRLVAIDGPRQDVDDRWQLAYHDCAHGGECGQLAAVTSPLGQITTYDAYDAAGNLLQSTDANGTRTLYRYDSRQRLVEESRVPAQDSSATRTIRYAYDAIGQLLRTTWPDGSTVHYGYDDARYLREIVDELGNRQQMTYDTRGNLLQRETIGVDGTTMRALTLAYDHRGYVMTRNASGSLSRQIADALGNPLVAIDANGHESRTEYDARRRPLAFLDALDGTTRYRYDEAGQVDEVETPNGATTRYRHDDLGNLLEEDSPDRGRTVYRHDDAGNVVEISNALGKVTRHRHDAMNRLVAVEYGDDTPNVYTTYDACANGMGRVCEIRDGAGVTRFDYDAHGNIVREQRIGDDGSHETRYAYDTRDRVTEITYPDGRQVHYVRDAAGRITSITTDTGEGESRTVVANRTYRADGLLTVQQFGNGLAEERDHDDTGWLLEQRVNGAVVQQNDHDGVGNPVRITEPERTRRFDYDPLHRLATESVDIVVAGMADSGWTQWHYDANGNRLARVRDNGKTRSYQYQANTNRLLRDGTSDVVLDAAGNLLADRRDRRYFHYDSANRLVTFHKNGVRKAEYTYNGRNQRIAKILYNIGKHRGTRTFHYFYDPAGRLLSEYRNGKPHRDYLWDDDMLVSQEVVRQRNNGALVTKKTLYAINDHLSTPRRAYDETGTLAWRWLPDAFGQGKPERDVDDDDTPNNIRLRFPGQYADSESGLYYNWNRYYDPRTGRYITSDPIGLVGGLNSYQYGFANPTRFVDPEGLNPAAVILGGMVVGGSASSVAGGVLGAVIGILLGSVLLDDDSGDDPDQCDDDDCPPCRTVSGKTVPVGTIAYRPLDTPPSQKVQHGISGPHYNIYKANQAPRNSPQPCKCFWQPVGAVSPADLPSNAIPIEPFAN